jgi:hypothetical protein
VRVIARLADPAEKQYSPLMPSLTCSVCMRPHTKGAMNIVLAVALVSGGFAAVAAHTDELGHELWVFPDDHTNPVSTNGKHCGQKPTAVGLP